MIRNTPNYCFVQMFRVMYSIYCYFFFWGKLLVRTLRRIRKNFPLTKEVTRLSVKASFASLSLSCNPTPPPYLVHCVSDTDKASQITRNQLNIFTLFICVPITRYDCVLDYTGHPEIARKFLAQRVIF